MDVAPIAFWLFAFLGVLGTMLHYATNDKRPQLESVRTRARADPKLDWIVDAALRFSRKYLDFIFGPYTVSLRAFAIILAISLVTTFIVLGLMTRTMNRGISSSVFEWGLLLAFVDLLSLLVTRKIVNVASTRHWRAGWTVALTLCLIAVVAYFGMGLAWCVYDTAVQLGNGQPLDPGLLALIFSIWLPSLLWTHNTQIAPAAAPGAIDTLFLLGVIGVPALFASTAGISRPLFLRVLNWLLALPRSAGKTLGFVGAVLGLLAALMPHR